MMVKALLQSGFDASDASFLEILLPHSFNNKFTDKMRRIKVPLPPVDEKKKVRCRGSNHVADTCMPCNRHVHGAAVKRKAIFCCQNSGVVLVV